MKESRLWKYVKPNFWGHSERIENTAGSGIPDVNTCWDGHESWIELKIMKGYQFFLRRTQYNWISNRLKEKGNVFILIGNKRNTNRWQLDLISGSDVLKTEPCNEKDQYYIFNIEDVEHTPLPSPINWHMLNTIVYFGKNA